MKTTGIALGWDLENKKLVLQDAQTELIARVDLLELNENVNDQKRPCTD